MILIADSGSTKCDWVLLDNNKQIANIKTRGINPKLLSIEEIGNILQDSKELKLYKNKIKNIFFYGAGCATKIAKDKIKNVCLNFFKTNSIQIEEDLNAAVYGTTKIAGVVCILGTGSNCCFFDGEEIHIKQMSLGYSVMDEASGNYFGRILLNSYYYNKMPLDIKNAFENKYELSLESTLKGLYESENPSAFLAQFASFIIENKSNTFISSIIDKGITELFDNLIMCYKDELDNYPIHFVGSIAFFLQNKIIKEAEKRSIRVKSFVKSPISNIITNFIHFKLVT
jgi:N-acetylglucosamine kinase-like BadF-type ATPase